MLKLVKRTVIAVLILMGLVTDVVLAQSYPNKTITFGSIIFTIFIV